MNIIPCPSCGCRCKIPATAAGKKVKCPRCATLFPVPASDAAPPPSGANRQRELPGDAPVQADPATHPTGLPKPSNNAERRSGISIALIAVGAVVALFLASAGGGLLVWFLLLRSPAPSAAPLGPAAAANDETKQAAKGPSPEEIQAKEQM